jgi:hypothetical protein
MAPRLLSFLTLIEKALVNQASPAVSTSAQRAVNFHKGLARMVFSDGTGSIQLQTFVLADGETCIKAALSWTGANAVVHEAIYPQGNFDWYSAAEKIAQVWVSGPKTAQETVMPTTSGVDTDAALAEVG